MVETQTTKKMTANDLIMLHSPFLKEKLVHEFLAMFFRTVLLFNWPIFGLCIPVILYGLEACPLTKSDLQSMDYVINYFFYEIISDE